MQNTLKHIRKITIVVLTAISVVIASGCTKPDDPNNGGGGGNSGGGNGGGNSGGNGTYNGHAYVDLGLPSGTLWATCNVGATTPEEYGDKFAWGETAPKEIYKWSTYKYCATLDGEHYLLTKYCTEADCGYNGFTDNIVILQSEDDAATTNWGTGWRTPTKEEWKELFAETAYSWTIQNAVNGYLFVASNGNSLFMPAWDDDWGDYWSSSLNTANPYDAIRPGFGIWGYGIDEETFARKFEATVRPVRSTNNYGNHMITASSNPTNGGIVTGAGTYQWGECCTLRAMANSGYTFTNWTENGTVVSDNANYSFGVTTNRTLVANFTSIPLVVTDFEWYREGSSQGVGLDDYGLYWATNAKPACAQIKPLDGVTLYSFDSSVWNTTETEDDKAAIFSNSTNIIEVYNNVSVWASATYDDVIGTRKADGSMHLIHVTNCVIGDYQPGVGYSYHIYGQSK